MAARQVCLVIDMMSGESASGPPAQLHEFQGHVADDDEDQLRQEVLVSITDSLARLDLASKDSVRALHAAAVEDVRNTARKSLARWEDRLISQFASGPEVDPQRIRPMLVPVQNENQKRLFRYAALHWSIPVSNGYGRRLRFLVTDEHTGKLAGIIGLGDPVFALRDREKWIGWDGAQRAARLRCVLDAFVLGAVPPYSMMLGGKLIAALATTAEIQDAFWSRYGDRPALISGRRQQHPLVLITTTSAFGRSSMYNRLTLEGRRMWTEIGRTSGHGEFLYSGALYDRLHDYVTANARPSARHANWGPEAWRNRREVVRKGLGLLGLPYELHVHGVGRSIYAAELGTATREFLRGGTDDPGLIAQTIAETSRSALDRWVIPRAMRREEWRDYDPGVLRLWSRED
jgi:hypothetical protein